MHSHSKALTWQVHVQPDLLRDAALAGNSDAVAFLCEAFNNATQIPLTAGTPGFVHPDLRGAAYIAGVAQPPGCNVIQSEQFACTGKAFALLCWQCVAVLSLCGYSHLACICTQFHIGQHRLCADSQAARCKVLEAMQGPEVHTSVVAHLMSKRIARRRANSVELFCSDTPLRSLGCCNAGAEGVWGALRLRWEETDDIAEARRCLLALGYTEHPEAMQVSSPPSCLQSLKNLSCLIMARDDCLGPSTDFQDSSHHVMVLVP